MTAQGIEDKDVPTGNFKQDLSGRYNLDKVFATAAWTATIISVVVLAWLLFTILQDGLGTLNPNFFTAFPSRKAEQAGIKAAFFGTMWVMGIVAAVSFPIGVGAAIYLEEFATDNWFTRLVEINIGNLAGVPSIIYGLLGLAVFVRILEPLTGGRSVLSGGLTLSLLILPVIIVATREALRAVPNSIRLAGFALGANQWQVVWHHVLPSAMPGVLTGVILALSRAIGETAPLLAIGAVAFIRSTPENLQSPFTAMPIQIYNWVGRPQEEFHHIAASGIIVLMVMLLLMNTIAIYLRNRFQKTH
ncbi:phosphate ABC transporter permease PstA [Leptolyngbyaceae cyanobacterium CCMR0082]|uniref:Phosphate transport system permease protein PstA n=1 Tax=Adonisia turfae CCMR0082 TaxID=2304604 RepID=A0A6M0S7H2_9CYAN|nr:phosphate ABC transporter permease PstA [Adonisia turfae]MDV3353505.1 phosphate ABC transporter permease PstA [Leptothoe sp. LEGE 181152]NEZ63772.1 phosphate ABC transporter permease PstA [Adonisia turfae CCMR0082]